MPYIIGHTKPHASHFSYSPKTSLCRWHSRNWVWQLPQPAPPSEHPFKYRLVYVVNGARVVGYDNERGKGDHKHIGDTEMSYAFKSIPVLLADFWKDVEETQ